MTNHYKIGDIVVCPRIWGGTTFTIEEFWGNEYCLIAIAHMDGKPKTNAYRCNLAVRDIMLVGAPLRPMMKLSYGQLLKLMGKRIVEAKREFLIRKNCNKSF